MDRNLILAIVLSMGILLFWDLFIAGPQREAMNAEREAAEAQQAAQSENQDVAGLEGLPVGKTDILSIDQALEASPGRVPVETPNLKGSINLQGGRIDDLHLTQYRETLDENSPTIRLLSPREAEHGHYIQQGWIVGADAGENEIWRAPDGATLTPSTPLTLTREKDGLVFTKTISVDERFMFKVDQEVANNNDSERTLTPYALVIQRGKPDDLKNFMILHEGPVGVIGETLYERKYDRLRKNKNKAVSESGVGGWVGITNKYWLAAAIPPQTAEIKGSLTNVGTEASPIFHASYSMQGQVIAPGQTIEFTSYMFGGPKDVDILQSYEHSPEKGGLGVYDFDKAVDWGNFFFLTRPDFLHA